jgi:hypothetical protein
MSPNKHNIFVLDVNGKPLTPTTNTKAYKLLKGGVAKKTWNKFGQFGIQLLVDSRKEHPDTSMGCDFGTKFEGYAVVVGKENNVSVMWKLPDKKKIVRKLEERKNLRRARRHRNCRRRECRVDNRNRNDFIAPSQKVIVDSRLKAINEFFRCYPIDAVVVEDVCFNHKKDRWGKNFSTVEIGKTTIYKYIKKRALLQLYQGYDTEAFRELYGYQKSHKKNAEVFNSHCADALALAVDSYAKTHIEPGLFLVVDDTYRPTRRRLHDTQPAKGGIRANYSTGNFQGIRKGSMCEFGQIVGGTKKQIWYRDFSKVPQKGKMLIKVGWVSHDLKTKDTQCNHPRSEERGREGLLAHSS